MQDPKDTTPRKSAVSKAVRMMNLALYLSNLPPGKFATRNDILANVEGYEGHTLATEQGAEAFRRMFEQDKHDLRAQGIVFTTDDNHNDQGYKVDAKSTFMAPVEFTPQEIAKLRVVGGEMLKADDFPFKKDLSLALAKIVGQLGWNEVEFEDPSTDADFDIDPAAEERRIKKARAAKAQSPLASNINKMRSALAARKSVTIAYKKPGAQEKTRRIRPYGDFSNDGVWYSVAYDEDAQAVRTFRLDRIASMEVNRKKPDEPDYEIPASFDVDAYKVLPFQLGQARCNVRFAVEGELAPYLRRLTMGKGSIVKQEGGDLVWEVEASDIRQAASWCIAQGPGITPLGPQELVDAYTQTLEAAARQGARDVEA